MIGGRAPHFCLLPLIVLPPLYGVTGSVAKRDTVAEDLVVLPEPAFDIEPVAGS